MSKENIDTVVVVVVVLLGFCPKMKYHSLCEWYFIFGDRAICL